MNNRMFDEDVRKEGWHTVVTKKLSGIEKWIRDQNNAQANAGIASGWGAVGETWTYATGDDPSYTVYVSGDVTASPKYKLGNKVRCTNNATTFYGWISLVGVYDSGNDRTPVTLYGGTDYDLANLAITNPSISNIYSPDGFTLSRAKWDQIVTSTATQSVAPAAATWYGGNLLTPPGPSIVAPIGLWDVSYKAVVDLVYTSATVVSNGTRCTLSTANNTESDSKMTAVVTVVTPIVAGGIVRFTASIPWITIPLTSKTSYFLNVLAGIGGTTLSILGAQITTSITFRWAYLP